MARIAFVLGEDFEDSEFRKPYDALKEAGHHIDILGAKGTEKVKGKKGKEEVKLDGATTDKDASSYDALVIPGGYSPDHLRMDKDVVRFVGSFAKSNKLIAAVCHGPQLLIEADAVEDKTMTSWPSVHTDLVNAGAKWVDQEVVVDRGLVSSRNPKDIPAFNRKMIEEFAEGRHDRKSGRAA